MIFWEHDVLAKQEQMKDRWRRHEDHRLSATVRKPDHAGRPKPRRFEAWTIVRAIRQRLLPG